ncbi:SapC family protein [Mesorhizobium amorphae]|uniref:SapC family protein n=1 Tax=Mesorhizobium amorphae CCNWGS0123 TaxID=1082933 RepID=G6YGH0_9HYPH|nr:hypothetical protein MEA186_25394 [Mesorhizobium amorphae CCNWGS0123]
MPLFYSRPEALNPVRHGSLGLTARADFDFARSAHAIPVVASEMPAAMRSYPIVFIGAGKAPVIITGLRQNENLFVDADGRWTEPHYVPAYVRRYPFVLADETTTTGRLTLCVDRASERVVDQLLAPFREDGGRIAPFFNGTEAADATKQALTFCNQFQADFNATRAMIDKIDAHGLFAPRQSKGDAGGRRGAQPHRFPGDRRAGLQQIERRGLSRPQEIRSAGAGLLSPRLLQQLDIVGLPGLDTRPAPLKLADIESGETPRTACRP